MMANNKSIVTFFITYLIIVFLVLFRIVNFWPFVPYDMFSQGFIKENQVTLMRAGYYDSKGNLVFFKYVNSTRWMRQKYRDAIKKGNYPLVQTFLQNDCAEQEIKLACDRLKFFVAIRTATINENSDVTVENSVNYTWSPVNNE